MILIWPIRCTCGTFGKQICVWRRAVSVFCRQAWFGGVELSVVASQYLVTSSVGLKAWHVGHAIFADASQAGEA